MRKSYFILLLIALFGEIRTSIGQVTVTMQREGGVYTVPCLVNGLKLKFIFDTGASNVSLSLAEAVFMLKNGYLKPENILGNQYFTDATGGISAGTKIILEKVEFANITLNNVEATVVHELAAPLLLGQSAMAKLGKFQIDPNTGVLTILNGQTINSENKNYSTPSNPETSAPREIFDYSKLPGFSGRVKVTTGAPIFNAACQAGCKQVGAAEDGKVNIISRFNDSYYYVETKYVRGYLWYGWIKGAIK